MDILWPGIENAQAVKDKTGDFKRNFQLAADSRLNFQIPGCPPPHPR